MWLVDNVASSMGVQTPLSSFPTCLSGTLELSPMVGWELLPLSLPGFGRAFQEPAISSFHFMLAIFTIKSNKNL